MAAGDSAKVRLFEVMELSDGVLNFGNVVLNELHVLRSIMLRNLTDDRLCVNIRCKSSQLQVTFTPPLASHRFPYTIAAGNFRLPLPQAPLFCCYRSVSDQ